MDLGDFFGGVADLGSAYISAKFGPPQPQGFLSGAQPGVLTNDLTGPYPPAGIPPVVPPGGSCNPRDPCGPSPVWKKVAGQYKWVTPKRRRRRQLITQSDAAGLAKLKGIVGQGKTMEVWIATHGGR